ncbi:MAG: D-alanyl-D-alanine carboxypeptidase, partial [Clostridia bacterium]|nr:D-alanyl-D-alanine carboxypeptidase [Clostridia bacterium]
MKLCKKLSVFFLCALFLVLIAPAGSALTADAATASMGECVVEVSSRRFLSELNADKKLPMASTTKIMTALVILEEDDLDEVVTVPKEAEGTEGSSVYLKAGEEITVRELLYGLMLRSGNDCAVTLALHHSGSVKNFARAMNEKAASLGAENSHFTNPHGLPDEEHYTTARDLALITAAAMENESFREIVSTKFYKPRSWKNKNKMLWNFDGAIGVKTGFTVRAGRCLVSAAERDGMTIVSVVLNSPQMFERSEELLQNAFETYHMVQLCS